jgi:Tol biopolymer transport system component
VAPPGGWSGQAPDGTGIALRSGRGGNDDIYVMDADGTWNRGIYRMVPDGSEQVRLTDDPANDAAPGWPPDGAGCRIAWPHCVLGVGW